MTISQLKDEHMEKEARYNLSKRIDVVLCDSSVNKVVPKVLGKPFNMMKK